MNITTITGNTVLQSGSFPPARVASTGSPLNPAAGGLLVVDGVQLVAGDRVLCKDETSAQNNGIYAANTGPWTRTTDATTNQQFFSGMAVTVALGAVNAGQTFLCTCTDDPVVVGTSLITWASQQAVETAQQSATSTTSQTIGTGSMTWAVPAGKAFQVGNEAVIYETSNPANVMLGQITAYGGGSLTVDVTSANGSGTHSDWTIALYPSNAAAGIAAPLGTGNVTGPGSSTAGHAATFADGTGKILQDGGTLIGGANTILPSMFANAAVAFGVGMLNGTLKATVAGNALTIAVKTLAGNDPSASDPVFFLVPFVGVGGAQAGWTVIEQTAALSITVPAGATLGTANGQANRIWVGVFNNAGAAVLGVYNSLNGTSILPWDETSATNGTGVTSSSAGPQTWYTASTLTSAYFRILGYVESTQSTAGQWAAAPNTKLFGPGARKPGDIVSLNANNVAGASSTTSASSVALSGQTVTLTVQSAANLIEVEAFGTMQLPVIAGGPASITAVVTLSRGTTANTNLFGTAATAFETFGQVAGAQGGAYPPSALLGYDQPNTTGAVTYAVQGRINGGFTLTYGPFTQLAAREIQV